MYTRKAKLSSQIIEEACSWFIEFGEGTVDGAGRRDFDEWLRRSPEHVKAYLHVSTFWEDAEVLTRQPRSAIDAAMARAVEDDNVFPFTAAGRDDEQGGRSDKADNSSA